MTKQTSTRYQSIFRSTITAALLLAIAILMVACGGGSGGGKGVAATYTLEGTLSGLTAGGLVLSNGNDSVSVPANSTAFLMPTAAAEHSSYHVIVSSQPQGLYCTVSNGSGTILSSAITNIQIECSQASSTSTNVPTTLLTANAGPICEANYSGDSPGLAFSCNAGSDPTTGYLDGSRSTSSNSASLSYAWSFVFKPSGSTVALVGADTSNPSFVPDKAGAYAVQLVVTSSDGSVSQRAVTQVIALDNAMVSSVTPRPYPYFHGGLSGNCNQCHSVQNAGAGFRAKMDTHIPTSDTCQTCHWPIGFNTTGFVDHKEVFGKCSDCHDGVIATGKSASHIQTTQECSDCHTTDGFLTLNPDGTFDHSSITSPCSACHNGTTAKGTDSAPNPPGHPSISVECNNCHTTVTFSAPFVNHSTVTPGSCGQSGCHDGLSTANGLPIIGKNSAPNPHPDTGNIVEACDLCHDTTGFNLGGVFDHGVLARHPIACKSCHDGQNATGMIAGHIGISASSDCSNCHNTSTFVGGFIDHATAPEVIGAGAQCTDCHDGTHTWSFIDSNGATVTLDIPGVPTTPPFPQALEDIHTAATGQSCGSCHTAGGSFALATVDHSGFGTLASPNPSIDCISCHDGTTATGKNVGHLDTAEQCGACHDPQSDSFSGAGYDHSSLSITGNTSSPSCESCHNGTAAIGKSLTHVPFPTVGDHDCLVCHHDSTYTSFAMQTFNHQDVVTANGNTPITCNSCHDGKSHDGVIVISKPSGHIPTTSDCSLCHDSTNNGPGINGTSSSGFATADLFVNAVHNAFNSGCRTCHNGVYTGAPYLATFYSSPINSTHVTANSSGWDCNACHTTTGGFAETSPVNHQDPAVKVKACINCHDGKTPGATPKNTGHPLTSDLCQNCHQAGGSFVAGFDHATLDSGGSNQGLACSTCHNGVNATGMSDVPPGKTHVPTSRDCIVCHAGHPPTVSSFIGGTFDHGGPEMNGKQCMDCHNNVIAIGKSVTHLATSQDCGACHTTDGTFASNATNGFNHTGVVDGCEASGCHAAGTTGVVDVTDDPNPLPHIPIVGNSGELNCYSCHKNAGGTFANAAMDHSVVTFAACEDCHDGQHDGSNAAHKVTTKSSNHMITSVAACDDCHKSTSSWTVGATAYTHVTSNYPGDHSSRRITSCSQCHNNNPANEDISTFPKSPYGSTCAACHASDGTREHGNPLPSKYYNCGNSGCHRVSSSSF